MDFDFSNASDSIPDPLSYFSGRSEDYETYRPVHPPTAIDAILAGLKAPAQLIAADVGAGTGIGSRLLAERGIQVLAIEPNADMRSAATTHPGVQFLEGTAEALPLDTASLDLVTSFQAFHWFDFTKSLQEFRRVLKPGGRLALIWSLWNQRDTASKEYTRLVFETSKCQPSQVNQPSITSLFKRLRYQLFWSGLWLPDFTQFRQQEVTFKQSLDLKGLIGLAYSQGFTPSEGVALEKLVSALSTFHDRFCNAQGWVQLSYQTRLYLAIAPSSGSWFIH